MLYWHRTYFCAAIGEEALVRLLGGSRKGEEGEIGKRGKGGKGERETY